MLAQITGHPYQTKGTERMNIISVIKHIFTETAALQPKTVLEQRRDDLADELEGADTGRRHEIFQNLMNDDPELYQSWIQNPYVRRPLALLP